MRGAAFNCTARETATLRSRILTSVSSNLLKKSPKFSNLRECIFPTLRRDTQRTSYESFAVCRNTWMRINTLSGVTYQRSFFTRTVRIWNALADDIGLSETISLSLFKAHLLSYYKQSLCKSYDPEDPRSFKSICTSCNKARNLIRNIDCCY